MQKIGPFWVLSLPLFGVLEGTVLLVLLRRILVKENE